MTPKEIYRVLKDHEQSVCRMLGVSGVFLVTEIDGNWFFIEEGENNESLYRPIYR